MRGGLRLASFATRFYIITTLLRQKQFAKAVIAANTQEGILQLAKIPTYYNWLSRSESAKVCEESGFKVVNVDPIGIFSGYGSDGMTALVDLDTIGDNNSLELLYDLENTKYEDF